MLFVIIMPLCICIFIYIYTHTHKQTTGMDRKPQNKTKKCKRNRFSRIFVWWSSEVNYGAHNRWGLLENLKMKPPVSLIPQSVTHTLHHLIAPPPDGDISLAFFLRGFVLKFHTHPCLCVQLCIYVFQ